MALGPVDYGLFGVVGGLTVFIAFINQLLSSAMGRFYAYSIGAASIKAGDDGLEDCRRWFNTAVTVHTVVPICLMLVGYPIGEYAVRHWLTIPAERIATCVWVFRFACVSCLASMVNVPFMAMYTAKQYIAELTVYSVIQTIFNVCFGYYMVTHEGSWLFGYSLGTCLMFVLPRLLICFRALAVFPECKLRRSYWFDWSRIKQVSSFAGWQLFGALGSIFRNQGIAIVVNKAMGPAVNAAMGVANNVNAQAGSLSTSLIVAFSPAITQACGAGDYDKMRRMAIRVCKFAELLALVFFVPLAIEIKEVMVLWLKDPPAHAPLLCLTMIVCLAIDKSTIGHMVVVHATGKIALYQAVLGGALILSIPLALVLLHFGLGIYAICLSLVVPIVVCAWGRVFFTKYLAAMSIRQWLFSVMIPVAALIAISVFVGMIPSTFMPPSFLRVVVTTILTESVLLPIAYFAILDSSERAFVKSGAARAYGRLFCGAKA